MFKKYIYVFLMLIIFVVGCTTEKHYNEWVENDGKRYYYDATGKMVKNKYSQNIEGSFYGFNNNGEMIIGLQEYTEPTTIDKDIGSRKLFLFYDSDGKLVEEGWRQYNEKWYYIHDNAVQNGGWMEIDGKYYYLQPEDGSMAVNKLIDNKYYVGNDGVMKKDAEVNINGKQYKCGSDGIVRTLPSFTQEFADSKYNFYIKEELPIWIESYNNVWILENIQSMELEPYGDGLHLYIKGIVSHFSGPTGSAEIKCRISMVDENGITSSTEASGRSSSVKSGGVNGEKTYISFDLKGLPLFGGDFDIEFNKLW